MGEQQQPTGGEILRAYRNDAGWTQKELTDKLKSSFNIQLSDGAVSNWEREDPPPGFQNARFADRLLGANGAILRGFGFDLVEDAPASRIDQILTRLAELEATIVQNERRAHRRIRADLKQIVGAGDDGRALAPLMQEMVSTLGQVAEAAREILDRQKQIASRLPPVHEPQPSKPGSQKAASSARQPSKPSARS